MHLDLNSLPESLHEAFSVFYEELSKVATKGDGQQAMEAAVHHCSLIMTAALVECIHKDDINRALEYYFGKMKAITKEGTTAAVETFNATAH